MASKKEARFLQATFNYLSNDSRTSRVRIEGCPQCAGQEVIMNRKVIAVVIGLVALWAPESVPNQSSRSASQGSKYLAFQVFVAEPESNAATKAGEPGAIRLKPPPSKKVIADTVQSIVTAIGARGTPNRTLGFVIGPLAFDHSDEELRGLVRSAFEIAQEKNVAVGFHIDDSMYWGKRKDLWRNPKNIEWLDWRGTPNTGRRIDWGSALKLAPQMCFNSPEIRKEVQRLATSVLGQEIKRGVDNLRRAGKESLFAGVIAGWETQMGRDFDTDKELGYCSLTNRGFTARNPPPDLDRAREMVVQEFIELWTKALVDAGIDKRKIYSHTAFMAKEEFEEARRQPGSRVLGSYARVVNFAPPSVAFGKYHNPGFSTYPSQGLFPMIYDELRKQGNPPWASSEGTNVSIGSISGEGSMETYLARMFNHGATLVNVFGWGVGRESDPFRVATERGAGALAAYRKFLKGEELKEEPLQTRYGIQAKVHRIQQTLPDWLRKSRDQSRVQPLMEKMMKFIQEGKPWEAEKVADEILRIIEQ